MQKFILFIVFFLAILVVVFSFAELESIWQTLQRVQVRFLLLGILIQLLWVLNDATEYRELYKLMEIDEKLQRLVFLCSAASFVNVVTPSGGMGGIAIFLQNAVKRNHSRGQVAATSALYLFLDYTAFVTVLIIGLGILFQRNNLNIGEVTASLLMFTLMIGLGILIYIGSRSAERLGKILAQLVRLINRLVRLVKKEDYLSEARARVFAADMAEGLGVLHGDARGLARPLLHAFINKALLICVMMMAFLNFHVAFDAGTIIAGFSMAYLFLIISPTPAGIGVVEGFLPLALSSLGVAWSEAVIVSLTYRAVTFWLPLLLGGFSFRLVQRDRIPT